MLQNKNLKYTNHYPPIFGEFTVFRSYKRDEIILEKDCIEDFVSYIHKGTVGMFLEKEGEDICYGLGFEESYISAYDSFLLRSPSQLNMIALENVVLSSISYEKLQIVLKTSIEGQEFGRKIAENLFIKSQQRIISFLMQSAEERYLSLISQRPEIFKKVKQKHIASYLGITPVSLSRIRGKITP